MLEPGGRGKPGGRDTGGRSEWVGGRAPAPMYLTDGPEPVRPEVVLWLELPDDLIVATQLIDPRERPIAFADTLRAAMARPAIGRPRQPKRVRVEDPVLAAELRAALPALEVVVAPTPEIGALIEDMNRSLPTDGETPSYFEAGRVSAPAVERLFHAAAALYRLAPWRGMNDGQLLRVDIPKLGVAGAALCIIGAAEEHHGLLLFPSLDAYDAFVDAAGRRGQGPKDIGTTILSLTYDRAQDLPPSLRREVMAHDWPVASAQAYPRVEQRDRDGMPRPLSERDVELAAACAAAFCPFFAKHRELFSRDRVAPVRETHSVGGLEVRITVPYQGQPLDQRPVSAAPPRPQASRNGPCACGSGKKYKKCCLPGDEARAAPPPAATQTQALHQTDRRLVHELMDYADRRFGDPWLDVDEDFDDVEQALALFEPWSVYGFPVDGRPVVDWFLDSPAAKRLRPDDRRWLTSQQQAWLSIWEITGVEPGVSLTVRDLLSGEERQVREVMGSRTLVVRDTVLARVVDHDGISVFCGLYPRALPPSAAAEVVQRVRAKLRRKTAVPVNRLRDGEVGRTLILRWEDELFHRDERRTTPPRLQNTDGDELLMTTDHFVFDPPAGAAVEARLAALDGVQAEAGATFTFVAPGNAVHASWDSTILGTARLGRDQLKLETNSLQRADALRARVEAACAGLLHHRAREHSDPIATLGDAPDPASQPIDTPETRQMLRELKERHYADWLDDAIPALGGRTPREAVRSKHGRQAVDVLLKDLEQLEARLPADSRVDVARLRRELGLPV